MTESSSLPLAPPFPQAGITEHLSYAYGKPLFEGLLRQSSEYFYVEEVLGFKPSGDGEHVFLFIEKIGINTKEVSRRLAKLAKVAEKNISYAGMKDRHAVSRQWFSVHLPGKSNPDWHALNDKKLTVLTISRHLKKLRRGVHQGNRFVIKISCLKAQQKDVAIADLNERLSLIKNQGVPNYFGEQRFGHHGNNLNKVRQWFQGEFTPKRYQRGLYLSAARSYLFNEVLSKRVENKSWNRLTRGELLLLNGSNSVFPQSDEPNLAERLDRNDIHLTGPMYGKQAKLYSEDDVASLENEILKTEPELLNGLEKHGLIADRRSLRLIPTNMSYKLATDELEIDFVLPRGCFATALLRECVHYSVSDNRK